MGRCFPFAAVTLATMDPAMMFAGGGQERELGQFGELLSGT